jgi:hypothetical protein
LALIENPAGIIRPMDIILLHDFITLVVQNRHEVLGRIENHEMNKKNERAAKNIHTFF